MNQTIHPINVRIDWCRRQSARARTGLEMDGWRAEGDGLRDALMNRDHTDQYRLCPPTVLRRYMLGFQDGTALLRAARVQPVYAATAGTLPPGPRIETDILLEDGQ